MAMTDRRIYAMTNELNWINWITMQIPDLLCMNDSNDAKKK